MSSDLSMRKASKYGSSLPSLDPAVKPRAFISRAVSSGILL